MRASMVYVPTCQHAKSVPTSHFYVPTSQRHINYSTWHANMPKTCQLFNLACQLTKGIPIFQLCLSKGALIFQLIFKRIFQFLNFSIKLNICKFLEYLGNSRKFILRNKEFKFWHLQNFIKEKPYQPKAFSIVFNGACGINQIIIWLV